MRTTMLAVCVVAMASGVACNHATSDPYTKEEFTAKELLALREKDKNQFDARTKDRLLTISGICYGQLYVEDRKTAVMYFSDSDSISHKGKLALTVWFAATESKPFTEKFIAFMRDPKMCKATIRGRLTQYTNTLEDCELLSHE